MGSYTDTCRACGKTFQNSHERRLMWCSVGCQFGGRNANVQALLWPRHSRDQHPVGCVRVSGRCAQCGDRFTVELDCCDECLDERDGPAWPDTLASCLAMAGALCEAFDLGIDYGFAMANELHNGVSSEHPAWTPGCNRRAR